MDPLQRTPGTAPTALSQDPPWLRCRERISLVKNRMREICTSGSVRDGDGNVPIYSALGVPNRRQIPPERGWFMKVAVGGEKVQLTSGARLPQVVQEQAPEHLRQHRDWKKVSWPAGDPALSIGRDPAARNQKMNMRMV